MSKKKVSGSSTTMTLKDFHGGSIPSDLRLPSAPGVITRPAERLGFDRQVGWGNPIGRSDHRMLRPGSAGSVRNNFDDKTPFLSPSTHIGRNFDEDERTPLDGATGPRRMVSDETTRAFPMELKPEYSSTTGRLSSRPISSPAPHATSYAGRIVESSASHVGANSHQNYSSYTWRSSEVVNNVDVSGNRGHTSSSSVYPNAWGIRKEVVTAPEPVPAARSGTNDAFKLAHASALDKISSGRWQSKQQLGHHQPDVEVIKHTVVESEFHSEGDRSISKSSYSAPTKAEDAVYQEAALVRHAERSLTVGDGIRGGGREFSTYEQPKFPMFMKAMDNNPPVYADGAQADSSEAQFSRSESRSPVPVDHSERPKLKLLPRSKPLESSGSFVDPKQGYQQTRTFDHMEIVHEADETINPTKPTVAGFEGGNQTVERPKLNIKPRSQPIEQFDRNTDRRNTVYSVARPRELASVNNQDRVQPPNRVKQDVVRTETAPTHSAPIRYNERTENVSGDNRIRKNDDRRDNRVEVEKAELQRRSWRNENWRNNRETEKHHQQQQQQQQRQQERPPSPETWRKPEQPKPESSGGPAPRYGKAASAVELAQAFSRPVSDPKLAERFPGPKPIAPGGGPVPFSRLMDQNSRPRINGY